MKQKRYFLSEQDIPSDWYNIMADMPVKPMPMLDPVTKEPVTVEVLSTLFSEECSRQELNQNDRWIEIPEPVREKYAYYRSTPLVRAYGLEKALGTPARIYFKNESVSPIGIIPAPESCHAIAATIREAVRCKDSGEEKVILFNLSGHGLIDMAAYDQYLAGNVL